MARLSRDMLCRRRLQLLDRLGLNCGWFRELFAYDRGITMQEGQVRYTVAAREAAKLRGKKVRRGEVDHRSFDVRGIPLHVEIPDEVYGRYLEPR